MFPELCSFWPTPWWTSTSGPAPASRVLSFAAFVFFFDRIVMISRDQFPSLSFSLSLPFSLCRVSSRDASRTRSRIPSWSRTPRARRAIRPLDPIPLTPRVRSIYLSRATPGESRVPRAGDRGLTFRAPPCLGYRRLVVASRAKTLARSGWRRSTEQHVREGKRYGYR